MKTNSHHDNRREAGSTPVVGTIFLSTPQVVFRLRAGRGEWVVGVGRDGVSTWV